jgi:hypothetical protein
MRKSVAAVALILLATTNSTGVGAETPDEWVALGARLHGGFGAFIPLGIKRLAALEPALRLRGA